ncbi:MAG: hypothetical protein HC908_18095 [Calothrix sp. SM1_7_51]|nr:hypothetical protein [Calothrix sp. SM1_7_51]
MAGKSIADLIYLPDMTNPKILAAMRIISSMFPAAYLGSPEFVPLLSLKMVDLSIEYGNTGLSANGYCTYGFLLCGVIGDIDTGYEFGQLSLNVLSKTNAVYLQATILLTYNTFIGYWKSHAKNFLKPLQDVYRIGLETGDLEFAGYGLYNYSYISYLTGRELTGIEREMATYCEILKRLQQTTSLSSVQIWQQTVLNLMNQSKDACCLVGEAYDETIMLPIHQEMNYVMAICLVYFNKLFLNYLFGHFSFAILCSTEAEKYLSSLTGKLTVPNFYLYDSLTRLAEYCNLTSSEKNIFLEKVNLNQQKMQHWAHHSPMNFLHKYYLVEAEKKRVFGEKIAAMDYYDKAIYFAKQNSYLQEEALANELAGKFYLDWDKQTIAHTYLTNAYYCYARWGALAKVNDLEKCYPQLLASIRQREIVNFNSTETISINSNIEKTITNSSSTLLGALDLVSFIKASQVISSEIE